jgi:hypothetical protein
MLWRIFPTENACQSWCNQQFAQMARGRAATNSGILFDYSNGRRQVDLNTLPDSQITGARFPLWGRNAKTGEWNSEDGFITAWAEPRETAIGEWAAPCREPNDPHGHPEPEWPEADIDA